VYGRAVRHRIDRPANCVEQGGRTAWLVALFVQLLDLFNWATVLRDDVLMIEEDEGQFRLARFFLMGLKEAVETAERFLRHVFH
jgi:hypothetical protein